MLSHEVLSDSLRPHGLQPARLLCPRHFPGKNTGVGCHFLLQGIFLAQGLTLRLLLGRKILFFFLAGGFFTTKLPGKPQHDAGTRLLDIKSFTTTARAKIKTVLMPTHGGSLSWSQGLETPPIIGIPCIKKREEGDYELNTYSVPGLMPVLYCLLYLLHLILALTHAPFVNTLFFFFLPHLEACSILVPWPGIELVPCSGSTES